MATPTYQPMLQITETSFRGSDFDAGYYLAALKVLAAIKDADRDPLPEDLSDGILLAPDPMPRDMQYAAMFLFRHFIELSLKYALHHASWLTRSGENAPAAERQPADHGHDLRELWSDVKKSRVGRLSDEIWSYATPDFIEACVNEMASFDPGSGLRHRYPGDKVGGKNAFDDITINVDTAIENLKRMRMCLWTLNANLTGTWEMNGQYEQESGADGW